MAEDAIDYDQSASWLRPYMAGHNDAPVAQETPDSDISPLRPYLQTSGRAKPVDDTLEIEAQVLTSEFGKTNHARLEFERRDLVSLCNTAMSVAEVSARLGLQIGVTRVLVADLAEAGYLVVQRPSSQLSRDRGLIERVIRGLEAIS